MSTKSHWWLFRKKYILMYLLFEHKVTLSKIGVLQTFDNKKVESSISKKNNKNDLYQTE